MAQYRIPIEETFSWQRPVKDKDLATPPVSPAKGDRYIVAASPTGAWVGYAKSIAWCSNATGPVWSFDIPAEGWQAWVNDEDVGYVYNGSAWVLEIHAQQHSITSTADHTSSATSGKMLKANANGLPVDATNTDTEVADAVTKKHVANADTALDPTFEATFEKVVNKSTDVAADGASDTKYATTKAVKTYADGLVVGLLDDRGSYSAAKRAISAFADYSATVAGTVKATSAAHGLPTGTTPNVVITDTVNYNGTYTVTKIDVNNFYFTKVFVATETGNWGDIYPVAGGSGTAGAILKGDLWFISVVGTLGGVVVNVGDSARALVDTPGQTAGNWSVLESNIGYVSENVANKDIDGTLSANSDTKYASQKATKTYADTKTTLAAVKADGDIADAISKKHTSGSETLVGDVSGTVGANTVNTVGGATAVNIASAVSLKHTQGTDQGLDTGGANAVTAAQAKEAYTRRGIYDADLGCITMTI